MIWRKTIIFLAQRCAIICHAVFKKTIRYAALAFSLAAFTATVIAAPPPGKGGGGGGGTTPPTTFSGEAAVLDIQVPALGVNQTIVQAGPLPAAGGAEENSLLTASSPGTIPDLTGGLVAFNAEVLHASTIGQGESARSEASVANLNLTVSGHTVTADFLMARASAVCNRGKAVLSGSSQVANLVVDGNPILVVEFPANYRIGLVDALGLEIGKITVNEQAASGNGGNYGAITVNALHVEIFPVAGVGGVDVLVSSTHADINCSSPAARGDFVTGGGYITATPSGSRANFGVAGGIKNGGLWGHLNYIDHGSALHVKGTAVTSYVVINKTTRRITGTAQINGVAGTYDVVVSDNGEPGTSDTFAITLSNGYAASGTLVGGNLQLHTR